MLASDSLTVSWFSAGGSSAVATKLMIDKIDKIIYTHIDDQHLDTLRFLKDCEKWFDKEIEILQSPYKNVETVCMSKKYINGVAGASCTGELKRKVRIKWEYEQPINQKITYIWGMDYNERHRAERLYETMPNQNHIFPLIEKRLGKTEIHEILTANNIKRPIMYDLGYHNNNCVGCVKGGMGYWNKIRTDFPDVFDARSKMERNIGASCINGTFLDELDVNAGRHDVPITGDCGILCELMVI